MRSPKELLTELSGMSAAEVQEMLKAVEATVPAPPTPEAGVFADTVLQSDATPAQKAAILKASLGLVTSMVRYTLERATISVVAVPSSAGEFM